MQPHPQLPRHCLSQQKPSILTSHVLRFQEAVLTIRLYVYLFVHFCFFAAKLDKKKWLNIAEIFLKKNYS